MDQFYFFKIVQFLQYDIYFPLSFIFLLILSLIYFSKIETTRKKKALFLIFILVLVIFTLWSILLTFFQYQLWHQNSISRYLLPPYQKIDYFLNYAYFHFWRDFLYRLGGSFFIFLFLNFLNFVFKRDIFYEEEKVLIPLLALFYFFPYNLFLISLGFFMLLLIIMINFFRKKIHPQERFSFKNYWLILAWLVFLSGPFFLTNYKFLKFKP